MRTFKFRPFFALLGLAAIQMVSVAQAQTTAPTVAPSVKPNRITGVTPDPKWLEEHAYTLGVQAYEYAWPWYYHALLRFAWTARGVMPGLMSTKLMTPNVFQHQRVLTDATFRDGGRPSNDTIYSATWADVTREPIIISVPDMGSRYFSIQMAGFDADNFDYVSVRTTGSKAAHYLIAGPNWKGKAPEGVKALNASPTNWFLPLVRILVDGPQDLPAVHALQDQIKITPLSQWGSTAAPAALAPTKFAPPFPRKDDPLADWKSINRIMTEVPPPARDAMLVKMFAQIGVGPGQDVEKMSEPVKLGLARAADMGRRIVTSGPHNNVGRVYKNGWAMSPSNWGRPGPDGQFLLRSAMSLGGLVVSDPQEGVYPALLSEPDGAPLNGNRRYVLRFAKGQLPPSQAFWSIAAYDSNFNLIDNPIHRYSVGDRSKDLKFDADGSLSIYVQKDAPGEGRDANWLPTGGDAFHHLVMRIYLPKAEVLNGSWAPPAIQVLQ